MPWAIAALGAAALVWALLPKPLLMDTATVSRGPMSVSVLEEGKTRIRHRYTISPPVGGFLLRVPLRAGAPVEAGVTLLAEIQAGASLLLSPRAQAEAEARVRAADAALSKSEADLERARAALDLAERGRQRALPLQQSGAISKGEWDRTDLETTMRARELRSAEFAGQVARFEAEQVRAALLQEQGGEAAGGGREPVRLVSPITGTILSVFEESARSVAPGTPIMELGDPTDLEAEIEMLSTDAAGVKPGATASIERWGGPLPLRAQVQLIEPAAFTKISALGVEEQRVRVRLTFLDALPRAETLGDRFRVEARIQTWSSPDAVQIPTGALFRRGGEWMCFVVERGRARLRQLKIGHTNGPMAEVLGGVEVGQRVAVHPPDGAEDGARVR